MGVLGWSAVSSLLEAELSLKESLCFNRQGVSACSSKLFQLSEFCLEHLQVIILPLVPFEPVTEICLWIINDNSLK